MALEGNQWLKGFQGLECAFEADRSWKHIVHGRGLSDDRADEIVGQDVRPNFLANELRCFASQDVHLQRDLDRS